MRAIIVKEPGGLRALAADAAAPSHPLAQVAKRLARVDAALLAVVR